MPLFLFHGKNVPPTLAEKHLWNELSWIHLYIPDSKWLDCENVKNVCAGAINSKCLTDHEYHEISDEECVAESPRFEVSVHMILKLIYSSISQWFSKVFSKVCPCNLFTTVLVPRPYTDKFLSFYINWRKKGAIKGQNRPCLRAKFGFTLHFCNSSCFWW